MSMHRFANAGPIMAGLTAQAYPALVEGNRRIAAMVEIDPPIEPMPSFAPSADDIIRMIENIADQLSEVAAQLVDVRKQMNAHEVTLSRMLGRLDGVERKAQQAQTFSSDAYKVVIKQL